MRGFRSGEFKREQVPLAFQRFSPKAALDSILDVDLASLKDDGKTLLLLDVDNTLLPWKSHDLPQTTIDWVTEAKAMGFGICVLSNTRHPDRLTKLCEKLELPFLRDKFKPHPRVYEKALEMFERKPDEAIMIGDQLLTDVWGANRAGIDAIWIKPLSKREFVGTRFVSRNFEWLIGQVLHGYLVEHSLGDHPRSGLFKQKVAAQAVKFALVGGVVTIVDLGLHNFLMFRAKGANGELLRESVGRWALATFSPGSPMTEDSISGAAYPVLKVGPVVIAILCSYFLNRWFTFSSTGRGIELKQMGQFYAIALVGGVIGTVVGAVVNGWMKGSLGVQWVSGSLAGMVATFIWNFNGQRLWTFREK